MDENENISIHKIESPSFTQENTHCDLYSMGTKQLNADSKLIQITGRIANKIDTETTLLKRTEPKVQKVSSNSLPENNRETEPSTISYQNSANLFRLFVKNGEYVYARSNDIIMIESCDHLVKVYVAFNDKMKKTIRYNTLKDFLFQLPKEQFLRIGRFCAVNIHRLSGGNFNEQIFEFDFKISIKLKHPISQAAFGNIGK